MRKEVAMAVALGVLSTSVGAADTSLDKWVLDHLDSHEKLLCQKQVEDDYFFVARSGGKLKAGYRLDVTDPSGPPATFIISWRFRDETGKHLGLPQAPEVIEEGYSRVERKMYAEEISYRDVYLMSVEQVQISVALKKYPVGSESPPGGQVKDGELERVMDCTANLP